MSYLPSFFLLGSIISIDVYYIAIGNFTNFLPMAFLNNLRKATIIADNAVNKATIHS